MLIESPRSGCDVFGAAGRPGIVPSIHLKKQKVIRLKAQGLRSEIDHRAHEQCRADQQHERERDLHGDERLAGEETRRSDGTTADITPEDGREVDTRNAKRR